jgi:hypothetical protein
MENSPVGDGRPGPGRPKGSQNRVQKAAKEAIEAAAEGLGGSDRLIAWAQEDAQNERVFWGTIYPKLLPLTASITGNLTVNWPEPKNALDE